MKVKDLKKILEKYDDEIEVGIEFADEDGINTRVFDIKVSSVNTIAGGTRTDMIISENKEDQSHEVYNK